jgi:DNA primase catalytic subunit
MDPVRYYSTLYPYEENYRLLGDTKREWATFDRARNIRRPLYFSSSHEFREGILAISPQDVHYGCVSKTRRRDENGKLLAVTDEYCESHELIFDVDLPAYDQVRPCACRKDARCPRCWELVIFAVNTLDYVLKHDLGFQHIYFFFSGMKGIHACVADASVRGYTRHQREAVVSYLNPENQRVAPLSAQSMWESFGRMRCSRLLGLDDPVRKAAFDEDVRKCGKVGAAMTRLWPKLDANVTTGLARILKTPFSLHGKTSHPAVYIEPREEFSPFDVTFDEAMVAERIETYGKRIQEQRA